MADLHHLLDEVLEPQRQEDEVEEQAEEWDEEQREQLTLPAALLEAERRKLNDTPDATEERLDLGDVAGFHELEGETVYSKLQALWTRELFSPEIMPYDSDTVQAMTDALQDQDERIEQLQTQGLSENAHLDALMARILKIDSERSKFMLSGMLKRRLGKLEEYPLHMREHLDRLSELEASTIALGG